MKREAAIDAAGLAIYTKVAAGTGEISRLRAAEVVTALEALGLIKFDEEPVPTTHDIQYIAICDSGFARIEETRLVDALRMSGYTLTKSGRDA